MNSKKLTGGIVHERDLLRAQLHQVTQEREALKAVLGTARHEADKFREHIRELTDKAQLATRMLSEAKGQAAESVSRNLGTGDACVRLLIGIDRAIQRLQ